MRVLGDGDEERRSHDKSRKSGTADDVVPLMHSLFGITIGVVQQKALCVQGKLTFHISLELSKEAKAQSGSLPLLCPIPPSFGKPLISHHVIRALPPAAPGDQVDIRRGRDSSGTNGL